MQRWLTLALALPLAAQTDLVVVEPAMGFVSGIATWNGSYTWSNPSGHFGLVGLVKHNGALLSLDHLDTFITIDPQTGLGTAGVTATLPGRLRGMATDPATGSLYAITDGGTGRPDDLTIVDPSTGTATIIGSTGITNLWSLAIDDNGVGYTWDVGTGLNTGQGLCTIDLATGSCTDVNPAIGNPDSILSLTFSGSGQLWGTYRGGTLIDAATGALLGSAFSSFGALTGVVFPSGATAASYGAGCPGIAGTPTLTTRTAPTLGAIHILRIDNLDPANLAVVTTGLSDTTSSLGPLPLDLQPFGLATGCELLASADAVAFYPVIMTSFTTGYCRNYLSVPANPVLAGLDIFFQAASIDRAAPGGLAVSNAIAATIR